MRRCSTIGLCLFGNLPLVFAQISVTTLESSTEATLGVRVGQALHQVGPLVQGQDKRSGGTFGSIGGSTSGGGVGYGYDGSYSITTGSSGSATTFAGSVTASAVAGIDYGQVSFWEIHDGLFSSASVVSSVTIATDSQQWYEMVPTTPLLGNSISVDDAPVHSTIPLRPVTPHFISASASASATASGSSSITTPRDSSSVQFAFTLQPIPEIRPEDILRNAIPKPTVSPSGYSIAATFTPANGKSLEYAARALGVDHFNWVQEITVPARWSQYASVDSGLTYFPVTGIRLDPPLTGVTYGLDSGNGIVKVESPPLRDDRIFYNDDALEIGRQTAGATFLDYKDAPLSPVGAYQNGEYKQFRVELVGVAADGTMVDLSQYGVDVDFSWKSDIVGYNNNPTGGGILLSPIDPDTFVRTGGHIFDVQLGDASFVPEGSPGALLGGLTVVAVIVAGRKWGRCIR